MGLEKQRGTKFGDTIYSDYHRIKRIVVRIGDEKASDQVRVVYGSYSDKESYDKGVPAMEEVPFDFYGDNIPAALQKEVKKFLKAIDKEALLTEDFADAIENDEDATNTGNNKTKGK